MPVTEDEGTLALPPEDESATGSAAPVEPQKGAPVPDRIAHYVIVREIGEGGMGRVFEARDEVLGRTVALKVLAGHLAHSQKAGLRFEQEAWIAGKLDHPNLVKVYERGTWEGASYFTMQFVDGGSLGDVVGNLKQTGRDERRGLEFGTREYAVWVLRQLAAAAHAIDYAHRHGVIHRDIKPVNLLLGREDGAVRVADFGLAIDEEATRLTSSGNVLGTLRYMAPEQILGQQDRIGPATDVYALGVTLFEMLTLELPFGGPTQQLYVDAVLNTEARRAGRFNARVGADLETVIHKALEKDPHDRYQSAEALADDLEAILEYRPIRARRPSRAHRVGRWIRRKPVHAALIALAAVSVPAVVVLGERAIEHRRLVRREMIDERWREVRWLAGLETRRTELVDKAGALLALDPRHIPALRARALAYRGLAESAGDDPGAAQLRTLALADAERIVELVPDQRWPLRLQAFLFRSFGRTADADAAETRARGLPAGPPSDDDRLVEAVLAFETGDFARAADQLTGLIARKPNSLTELRWRARAYAAAGRKDAALIDYRVAAAIAPDDFYTALDLGQVLNTAGELDQARSYLDRALAVRPGAVEVHEALADNDLAAGRKAFAAGSATVAQSRFERAAAEARAAVGLDPRAPWAHIDLGVSLIEQHRLRGGNDARSVAEAVEHYETARRLLEERGPGRDAKAFAAVSVNLCDALIQSRRLDRALDVCGAVARANARDPAAHYNLAAVLALLGRRDDALRSLEQDVALGDRDHAYLRADPWFVSLRADPRFEALLIRMQR